VNGKAVFPFSRGGTVDTPLAEPHGSVLAFLSDLHEQTGLQIASCTDQPLTGVLTEVLTQIEVAALIVIAAGQPLPEV
jgi:hypothetical protein